MKLDITLSEISDNFEAKIETIVDIEFSCYTSPLLVKLHPKSLSMTIIFDDLPRDTCNITLQSMFSLHPLNLTSTLENVVALLPEIRTRNLGG